MKSYINSFTLLFVLFSQYRSILSLLSFQKYRILSFYKQAKSISKLNYACSIIQQNHRFKCPYYQSRSTPLYLKAWYEDDLPNILGINPIEAAIIFGALYYFYGPDVLYDYTRQAGKLFSTYAPIVKELSIDIFNEFRDYLEENRERELMKKSGIDVDSMARRTTNIIERFQQGLSAFNEMTDSSKEAGVLQSAYTASSSENDMISEDEFISNVNANENISQDEDQIGIKTKANNDGKARKSKKEVLLERNVNIDSVLQATQKMTSTDDVDLTDSILAVKNSLQSLSDVAKADDSSRNYYDKNEADFTSDYSASMNRLQDYKSQLNSSLNPFDQINRISMDQTNRQPSNNDDKSVDHNDNNPNKVDETVENEVDESSAWVKQSQINNNNNNNMLGMSRFQQQMSGEWNQKVLRREKYASPPLINNNFIKNDYDDYYNYDDEKDISEDNNNKNYQNDWEIKPPFLPNDIPPELSFNDTSPSYDTSNASMPLTLTDKTKKGIELLKEIDQDYLALRQRLLNYLQNQ
eukprot:gene6429-8847_t